MHAKPTCDMPLRGTFRGGLWSMKGHRCDRLGAEGQVRPRAKGTPVPHRFPRWGQHRPLGHRLLAPPVGPATYSVHNPLVSRFLGFSQNHVRTTILVLNQLELLQQTKPQESRRPEQCWGLTTRATRAAVTMHRTKRPREEGARPRACPACHFRCHSQPLTFPG